MSSRPRKFWSFVLVVVLVLLIVIPIGLLYFGTAGMVTGVEFSPDDFSRRRFQYNVAPLFNFTIRGISYDTTTPILEQTLISDGLIVTQNATQWDLVSETGSDASQSESFDARFLTDYLDMNTAEGDSVWLQWNNDHPESCKVFWTTVATLARNQLYWSIPEIMRRALATEKDEDLEFEAFLAEKAAAAFAADGRLALDEGDHTRSVKLLTESINYRPSRSNYSLRAQAHQAAGNAAAAERDREAAKRMDR